MYRQIRVHEDDHNLQLILWRRLQDEPLLTYKLKTVTYGTSFAPFLATRCLKQLALEHQSTLPITALAIEKDIYVDDLLTGINSVAAAKTLKSQILNILLTAGMELRKWCSNCSEILEDVPPEFKEMQLNIDVDDTIKTLGICWNTTSHSFMFLVNLQDNKAISKRTIFSQIAGIYDPLGLLAPLIVVGKLFIQSLWQLKLDWDQSLPQGMHTDWQTSSFQNTHRNAWIIEIHGFADASEHAYGAVLYVRSITSTGHVSVKLMCSKSRVAPFKKITMPRLELCAAVLLAQLTFKISENLNFQVNQTVYWSDSTIILNWIRSCLSRWKTFVSHRVTTIQERSNKESWRQVPTESNPTDLLFRGLSTDKLLHSNLWLHGSSSLLQETSSWQVLLADCAWGEDTSEMKNIVTVSHIAAESPDILAEIKYHNDIKKIRRVIAYMLKPKYKFSGPLKLEELDRALHTIIRVVQKQSFSTEYGDWINQISL